MPIPKLRQLLDQGKEAWNAWREQHPDIVPDLRSAMAPYDFDLTDWDLSGMNLSRMDFQGARIARSRFPASHFLATNFQNANLSRAVLSKSMFRYADLSNANLCGAQLFNTHFVEETNLVRTNFSEAKLSGARFTGARLGWTIFGANDLSSVRGLDEVRIEGPITIGIDTVSLSHGKIPATFLRKAQIRDDAISFIRSVAKNPVNYCSCFISYSARNQNFADQLYKDLSNAGVVCWFATESLRAGEKFEEKIADAIRSFDRFVVLISKQSLDSTWVAKEVNIALDQEQQRKNLIVPISLDDSFETANKRWVKKLKPKHIIGFKTRGQSQYYFDAITKLLGALESKNTCSTGRPSRSSPSKVKRRVSGSSN